MLKKFYIVKDYKDLTSGQVIPQKVLNYLPANMFFAPPPMMIPVTKSPNFIIPVGQTNPLMYGAPIIKAGPLLNSSAKTSIHIISDRFKFVLIVPLKYLRNIVNDIYLHANSPSTIGATGVTGTVNTTSATGATGATGGGPGNPSAAQGSNMGATGTTWTYRPNTNNNQLIKFRILTPTLDSTVTTTFEQMIKIIQRIDNKYNNILSEDHIGTKLSLSDLINRVTQEHYTPI